MSSADRGTMRSMLYVPAHKEQWFNGAFGSGADAVILDLEDAVPIDRKAQARDNVRQALSAASNRRIFVRINDLASPIAFDDLEAVVQPGLSGVQIPKVRSTRDVEFVARVIDWLEVRRGLEPGTVAILPLIETADAVVVAHEIFSASERVNYVGAMMAQDGDLMDDLGFEWTDAVAPSMLRFQLLLAARAARVTAVIGGVSADIRDLGLTREFGKHLRGLGYDGMAVLHPDQVHVANEVFGVTATELERARRLVSQFEQAQSAGDAAIEFEGRMVDHAMARSAYRLLDRGA